MFYTANHFSGRGQVVMDWHLLGNGVAALECALVLAWLCRIGVRGLRKLPVPVLIVFLSLATGTGIDAQKTNGVNNLPPMPLPSRSAPVVATVTEDDVARGWRVECMTTNETLSYTMPSNAVYVSNWHIHGARSSFGNNVVNLGGASASDWAFPLGTNGAAFSSFWYFVDGRIRPKPKDAAHEICAVGVPMSAVPGRSRLWAIADGDSRVLTWENFFLGGDTNAPVNAEIRLFSNGDFTTRSNDVETVCRRVNPDDWDGDGLANEKDVNPLAYDGDFCGAANALPTNANLDAYYTLDVAAVGALDFATIRVTCDGPSDLGDHVVIARTNQVCHVPLLAGATYAVESDLPLSYSAVSSEHAHIVTNSATKLTVSLPIEFTVERVEMRGGGSDSYIVSTSPVNVGPRIANVSGVCCSCTTNETGFTWSCLPQCLCGGSRHAVSVFANWCGYSHPFTWWGRCHCYYEDQTAIDEIEGRGVSLEILDALGNAIEWKNPVLVGESIVVEATVGGSEMTVAGFAGLFDGRIRLKAYYVDAEGEHDIVGAPISISAQSVTSRGHNVFCVPVAASWLQSAGIVRNADDGITAKTSVDMSNAPDAGSDRTDSDHFDANVAGRLYGRARGRWGGNEDAPIPEGEFNLKTVQAAGTACIVASCGAVWSPKRQCQQQADVFYYSGHGDHDTGMLYGAAMPSDVSNRWHDVDTAVFAGCSVLDVGDKNNNYTNPAKHVANPGLKWLAASGADTLLGYAYKAPKDDQGGTAIVRSWCLRRSSLGDVEAWMQANDCRSGHNACAIRKTSDNSFEYHYFAKRARLFWSRQQETINQGVQ